MGFMPDPDQGKASCFSAGDLLTPWGGSALHLHQGDVGKGPPTDGQQIDDIGTPWAGNDVYGEGGYRGVRWIHRSEHNRSEADREVTGNWCEKQRARVERSCDDLSAFKRSESRVLDIVIVGNADGELFALPKAYNDTMSTRVRQPRENHVIQTIG